MSDVDEMLALLKALANAEHDDFSVVDEAVHEIKSLCGANDWLRAENERLRSELGVANDAIDMLRQDAERYLWLRNDALQMLVEGPIVVLADKWGSLVVQDSGSHISIDGKALDKNIDAAMKRKGER